MAPPSRRRQWAEVEAHRLLQKNADAAEWHCPPRPAQRYLAGRPRSLSELELSLASHICPRCLAEWPLTLPEEIIACEQAEVFVFFPYEGMVQQAFLRLKFAYLKREAYLIAAVLARQIRLLARDLRLADQLPPEGALVCPFPGTKRRDRQRGFNPISLILEFLSPLYRWRLVPDLLFRQGEPRYQHELSSRRERFASARESLLLSAPVAERYAGESIYLWDDIVTTGASLLAARELLATISQDVHLLAVAGGGDYYRRRLLQPETGILPSI